MELCNTADPSSEAKGRANAEKKKLAAREKAEKEAAAESMWAEKARLTAAEEDISVKCKMHQDVGKMKEMLHAVGARFKVPLVYMHTHTHT